MADGGADGPSSALDAWARRPVVSRYFHPIGEQPPPSIVGTASGRSLPRLPHMVAVHPLSAGGSCDMLVLRHIQWRTVFCGCRPGSKRIMTSGSDRVRSSVRPHIAALPKAAGRYGDQHDRVQIYSASCRARSPYLVFPILICSIISHIVSVFSLRLASYIGEWVMPPPVHLDPHNRCASSAWPKAAGPFCLPMRLPPTSLAFDASWQMSRNHKHHGLGRMVTILIPFGREIHLHGRARDGQCHFAGH